MPEQKPIYYIHQSFVNSAIEDISSQRERQKQYVTMLVDGLIINIEHGLSVSTYVCDKVCKVIDENPDFISDLLHHEPVRDRAWDGDIEKLTEDSRVVRNLEDILFYKHSFYNSTPYQKLISSIERAQKKLIL